MCGRFNLVGPGNLHYRFATQNALPGLEPRYNIAPSQQVVIITNHREMELVRWGLVPHWAKDARFGGKTINARAETIATKPIYREPFRSRRCLIPATGFYEWMTTPEGKIPYHIRLKSQEAFGFAGLYDSWTDAEGRELRSCTIITTEANELMASMHARMPVIIRPEDEALWLDPEVTEPERLLPLLRPYASDVMEAHPVSTAINRPANEGPELLQPVEAERELSRSE
jgi:putative SOS response-associated peptidase YedK